MDAEKAAKNIISHIEKVYVPKHDYSPVDPNNFKHLDLKFYEENMEKLKIMGFRYLIDEEDLTLKGVANDMRTFFRIALSADGTISSALYHPKPKFWLRFFLWIMRFKLGKVVDFGTEYSDGSFLVTSNAECAGSMQSPPLVMTEYLSWNSPLEKVYQTHMMRMEAYSIVAPDIEPIRCSGIDQLHASQHRLEAIKAAYRKEVGGVTKEELEKLSGGNIDLAHKVNTEIERLRAQKDD
jgi:hypothetical protein